MPWLEGGESRAVGRHGDERAKEGDEGGKKGGWVSFEFGRGLLKFMTLGPRAPRAVSRHPHSEPAAAFQTGGGNHGDLFVHDIRVIARAKQELPRAIFIV